MFIGFLGLIRPYATASSNYHPEKIKENELWSALHTKDVILLGEC